MKKIMRLDEFAGQAPRALERAVREGQLSHAVLLEGAQEDRLAELAQTLARAALCTGSGPLPCGECPHCVKALAGSHPDLWTAGGSGAARSFHVEEIRTIRADAYIRPNEAARKVYVLLGAHTMSIQAQNALLKLLEEPPGQVLFILTAPAASLLLPTIVSRVQRFKLGGEEPTAADPALIHSLSLAVLASGEAELLFLTAPLIRDREGLRGVLDQLSLVFRDACVLRAGGTRCLSGQEAAARALSGALTRKRLLSLLETVREGRQRLDLNANGGLLVTWLCAKFRTAAGG